MLVSDLEGTETPYLDKRDLRYRERDLDVLVLAHALFLLDNSNLGEYNRN